MQARFSRTIRRLCWLAGLFGAIPVAALLGIALFTPITLSGVLYLLGVMLIEIGALTAPRRIWRYRGVMRAGVLVIVLVAGARLIMVAQNNDSLRLVTLPDTQNPRWINRLVNEQDVVLFGERLAATAGMLSEHEQEGLTSALHTAYQSIQATEGPVASPFLSTYLNRQWSQSFDTIVIEPSSAQVSNTAVIFLHGSGGNFTLQCWLMAQSARAINALTVCPSITWTGNWTTQDAASTVFITLHYLRAQGVQRIYLAGLSNGGLGASRLAAHLAPELAGLILISGASHIGDGVDLPVLVIQGVHDQRVPAEQARAVARQLGDNGTYAEFDGDHFVLLKQAPEVRKVLAAWLIRQESQAK